MALDEAGWAGGVRVYINIVVGDPEKHAQLSWTVVVAQTTLLTARRPELDMQTTSGGYAALIENNIIAGESDLWILPADILSRARRSNGRPSW